ncbi:holo [Fusarium mundagurra]|uniref:Holo n=1 Tax=Fusarium mundagurra TaxID=1567541 RepID=A0A8H5XKH3_9HYPO|nr:holo [Fusarium mundagurra]
MSAPKFTPVDSQLYDSTYERDSRHVEVDNYVNSHLLNNAKDSYISAMDKIYRDSVAAGLPDIACSSAQAKFLKLQIQLCNATNVLEVGTLGGYSAAWMALAGPTVKITTIEIDKDYAAVASDNLTGAGLKEQVEILQGAGLDILPLLATQVETGERLPFDFVFIDANKQDNLAYFNLAVSMTSPNTAIIVDNVVRNGKVASADEAKKDDRVLGTRQLIEAIGKDDRVDATVIQTVGEKNYDGFLLAIKK